MSHKMRTILVFTDGQPSTAAIAGIIIVMTTAPPTWAAHALADLRDAGFRSGDARRVVVEHLGEQDCCLSAQELHSQLRSTGNRIGIASVYRVLDLLAAQSLVTRIDLGDGIARFEPTRPDGHHHHHVVCADCGKIGAFSDPELERALGDVATRLGYAEAHEVVLRGVCEDCRVG
jgi:Fur family ferric uptake transcriptional regulator